LDVFRNSYRLPGTAGGQQSTELVAAPLIEAHVLVAGGERLCGSCHLPKQLGQQRPGFPLQDETKQKRRG
jgi:hypothetical protein